VKETVFNFNRTSQDDGRMGFMGMMVDPKYGGAGLDSHFFASISETARSDAFCL
jgi:alkylation response protein AidB-like acyl-CoA dehydrogenase